MTRKTIICVVLTQLILTACSTTKNNGDPLEGMNRVIYQFNDKADRYVLKPVAKGYKAITPKFARKGVSNFFSNLGEPLTIVNGYLQGKGTQATQDIGRFLTNSIFGLFGLFDVATNWGLPKHKEDFGQTFAVWGLGDGPYLVLPFLGPSNLRDAFSLAPDAYLDPINYIDDSGTRDKVRGLKIVDTRTKLLSAGDILDKAGGADPYIFVRELHRQRRKSQIYDGNPPSDPQDDIDEDALLFDE